MVNLQDTPSAGQISAADLEAARQHSTGRIVHLRRAVVLPAGCDQQGRHATRQWPAFPDTVPTDWHGLDDCAAEVAHTATRRPPRPTRTALASASPWCWRPGWLA